MMYSIKQYAIALYDSIAETNPKDHDKVIDNFTEILKNNHDLHKFEDIITEFEAHQKYQNGEREVLITTAKETNVDKDLVHTLNKIAGKKAVLTKQTDDSIVGGMIVKVEDILIDGSIKTQLNNLNKKLKK